MRLNILILAAICALGALTTYILQQADEPTFMAARSASEPQNSPGSPAPDFTISDLEGKTHTLKDYRGKPVIVHFWATWCAPCVIEFPKLVAFAQKNADNITIIALSSDTSDAGITRFLNKQKMTLPSNFIVARDPQQKVTRNLFQTYKLPESVSIDDKGIMLRKMVGDQDWNSMDLKTILNNAPVNQSAAP